MSRVFTDENLQSWEAYASSGRWGFPENPKIVFNCLSDPNTPARFVRSDGSSTEAEVRVFSASDQALRDLLAQANEI